MATVSERTKPRRQFVPIGGTEDSALWYKDAIIYQLHVRAFCDSDGDGVGDFKGLTSKLDYIQSLGVTAIWLLPFYPSPLRDDGYDIADYTSINRMYGTLRDFKRFLHEAHRRDLRVITELVMNHTSDEHRWFQKSRQAKPGTKWRDFYVWSDDPERYKDTRIIFRDFETSNWTWDPVAGAYFWHRFYSHQPDLNFDNPDVKQAMFQVLDFWLEMGVDGFRLDAVPYLFEREGTTCENLPETHALLRELREYVDSKYDNKLLLAEANQWPEDAAAYFGDGDECHMNFHFPLMPRLFMSIQREDRFPIIDILQQTPELPCSCQWATFLRNHDELTLEMVTDEERDYMYRTYAADPNARINLGIRRRLAPLLKNNRRKMELMNALLFSLPGTPVLYYGDEIGMGDNIYLGDRDGVRTPMQWTADRNAGFSTASSQRLFLPVISDSEYSFATRNVEIDQNSPHSLLWWMRRLIGLRKNTQVFGRGSLEFLTPENSKVLAFLREYNDETVLVVANLSRFVQGAELDLARYKGRAPVEMFGHTKLPAIGQDPYFLTVGPYSFFWLKLESPVQETTATDPENLPVLRAVSDWTEVFSGKSRQRLERALSRYLLQHRWFAGKARTIQNAYIRDAVTVQKATEDDPEIRAVLLGIEYTEGDPETYLLPLTCATGYHAEHQVEQDPAHAIAWVQFPEDERGLLFEAIKEERFWTGLLDAIARRRTLSGTGELAAFPTRAFREILNGDRLPLEPTVHGGQQSNTSAIFGDRFILKLFRRVTPGQNPDFEIGRFLTEKSTLSHVPRVAGALEYRRDHDEPMTAAILHELHANEGDAWEFTRDELARYFERVSVRSLEMVPDDRELPPQSPLQLVDCDVPELAQETVGAYLQSAELLGQRTAEMHLALASDKHDEAFAPEAFNPFYQRGLYQSMQTQVKQVLSLLRKQRKKLSDELGVMAESVLAHEAVLFRSLQGLTRRKISGLRTRFHGDYHLGQVLYTGKDFVIIDFEGEPDRPLSERRIKNSPLRDVAGMLRSLHYAANAALLQSAPTLATSEPTLRALERWTQFWYVWTSASFLKVYLQTAGDAEFLPDTREEFEILLSAYVLHKLMYELSYELNNRPDWAIIPLRGIRELTAGAEAATS